AAPPAAAAPSTAATAAAGIAWQHAASDADVDAAFAQARAAGKPVFVYWGAAWCPPCNQVKATIFNRQDFIERSRAFVPVYVDGDSPGAQKLGARFHVSGYPTMLLFSPQGVELTRLPGEVDAARYNEVLTLGMNAQRPVKELLAQVKAGGQGLSRNDWRLLAFYAWDTDHQQLVPRGGVPALLRQLAAVCPPQPAEIATRLRLEALAASDAKAAEKPDPATQAAVLALLADAPAARAQMDVLTNNAPDITRALSARGTPQRAALLAAFDRALKRFEADTTLSRADRMGALIAQVDLAKIDAPDASRAGGSKRPTVKLPAALLADIRAQTARADREITDGYERQAVITSAAYLLAQAGLGDESDALLKANLAKSHSPYYLMSELAGNAKARGDTAAALHWYQAAFDRSTGPATRLQWGASYVSALVELAPRDAARIEQVASRLLSEAAAQPDAFYERSARSLQRMGGALQRWNRGGAHAAALRRLQIQLDGVCGALPATDPKRATCATVLAAAPKKSA
ncbi:MAG: thioredoxin family protein, partial [Burkholderiales bacterium]|nr:thioredoxin family protein [Burkholderiales bacterium]